MKFASLFGHYSSTRLFEEWEGWPLPKCNIGLEWEFEDGTELRQIVAAKQNNPYLQIHDDGSLRDHGVEIVTSGDGLYGKDLLGAIDMLYDAVKSCVVYKPVCNYRTGFHVHIDVRDMHNSELHNMLILYCLLEKPIFNFVGKDRWKSNFSVPWFRSEEQFVHLKDIQKLDTMDSGFKDAVARRIKGLQRYSAVNCQAIAQLGTVEFRHMENSVDEIRSRQMDFIRIVMNLTR